MKTNKHIAAIRAGKVTKTNVIGLRKAFNADARRNGGLSTSITAPNMTREELEQAQDLMKRRQPKVSGALHASGLKLLRSPRYAKIMAALPEATGFRLVRFDRFDDWHVVPVYRATGPRGSFVFRNIPWQSGGKGPEILQVNKIPLAKVQPID
jgi:hypothetical protein